MSAPTTENKFSEQRLQERFSMNLPVRVSTETDGEVTVRHEGVIANISAGGAFIATDKPLPVSSSVYLEFLISLEELKALRFILSFETIRHFEGRAAWVKASGIIIRHENSGMAIIFSDDYQLAPLQHVGD
jgi:hypothetical protein